MADVRIYNPATKQIALVTERGLSRAARDGWRVASAEDEAEASDRAYLEQNTRPVDALMAGLISAVPFAESALSQNENLRQSFRGAREIYPGTRTAGQIVGTVGGALLTGGLSAGAKTGAGVAAEGLAAGETLAASAAAGEAAAVSAAAQTAAKLGSTAATPSLLARAGSAILAPARLGLTAAPRAGLALGEAVATRTGLGTLGQQILKMGVAGGTEATIYGWSEEAGKLAVNKELVAEKAGQVFLSGLTEFPLGFATGSLFGAIGAKLEKTGEKLSAAQLKKVDEAADLGLDEFGWFNRKRIADAAKAKNLDPEAVGNITRNKEVAAYYYNAEEELAKKLYPKAAEISVKLDDTASLAQRQAAIAEATAKRTRLAIEEAERIANEAPTSQATRQRALDFAADEAKAAKHIAEADLSTNINNALESLEISAFDTTYGRAKVARNLEVAKGSGIGNNYAQQYAKVQEIYGAYYQAVEDAAESKVFSPKTIREFRQALDVTAKAIDDSAKLAGDEASAALFSAADVDLKREFGRILKGLKGRDVSPQTAAALNGFKDAYEFGRAGLEDAAFGVLGKFNKNINAPRSRMLGARSPFFSDVMESIERRPHPIDPWRRFSVVDPKKLDATVKESALQAGSLRPETFNTFWVHAREMMRREIEAGGLDPAYEALQRVNIKRIDRILEQFAESVDVIRGGKLITQLLGGEGGALESTIKQYGEAIPGTTLPRKLILGYLNPKGIIKSAAVGKRVAENLEESAVRQTARGVEDVAEALENSAPKAGAGARAAEEAAQEAVEAGSEAAAPGASAEAAAANKAAQEAVSGSEVVGAPSIGQRIKTGAAKVTGMALRTVGGTGRRAGALTGTYGFTRQQIEYFQTVDRIKNLSSQVDEVKRQISESSEALNAADPSLDAGAAETAGNGVAYLADKAPGQTRSPIPFSAPIPPTSQEIRQFNNRVKAVQNPYSILDDAAKGKLTPEAVEAVKTVYPQTWREIQGQLMDRVTELDAKGVRPSYSQRVNMGVMFDIATDPTLTREFVKTMQANYGSQPEAVRQGQAAPQPTNRAPNFAAAYQSGADETGQSQ